MRPRGKFPLGRSWPFVADFETIFSRRRQFSTNDDDRIIKMSKKNQAEKDTKNGHFAIIILCY